MKLMKFGSAVGVFELRVRSNRLIGDLPQALSFLPLEVSLVSCHTPALLQNLGTCQSDGIC